MIKTTSNNIETLEFIPLAGVSSPHLQTILAHFSEHGSPPPSESFLITLSDGDIIWGELSTPQNWKENKKTVLMIHGLGGSISSGYMIRMSRKLYQSGIRVLRINMRGCGAGNGLSKKPYHGGLSSDILEIVNKLKEKTPHSPLIVLGFSLGGNLAIKLAGEVTDTCVEQFIAICPPMNMEDTVHILSHPLNKFYNRYYLKNMQKQAHIWTKGQSFANFADFDNSVTAPQWGFKNASDYYSKSSCYTFIDKIRHPCTILAAWDDPFIDNRPLVNISIPPSVKVTMCKHGGHMGFLGWSGEEHRYRWMDHFLMKCISGN